MARATRPTPSRLTLAAHELRTPLSVAVGYLRLLRRQAPSVLPEPLARLLDESEHGCDRLAALISDMSRLGQLEAGTLTWSASDVDTRELLRAVASAHEADHVVAELGDAGPAVVRADPERLTEALDILLRATERRLGDRIPTIVHRRLGPVITVVIADADVIPCLLRSRPATCAFDETPGGFGLALPTAHCIVEASGGALQSPCPAGEPVPGAVIRWPAQTRRRPTPRQGRRE